MKIHHIGYAVKNINKAIDSFVKIGYSFGEIIEDKDRNVAIAFGNNQGYCIELIAPLSSNSPVDSVLEKNGPTPYHICYEVDSINDTYQELKKQGWMVVKKSEPAIAIDNLLVMFLYNLNVGLIELVESKK